MSDFFDKAKDLLAENRGTVDDVVDKVAGLVDEKTGGKHKEQVRQGASKAKDAIAQFAGADDANDTKDAKKKAKRPEAPADDTGTGAGTARR